jgi:hypothetical protein
LPRASPQKRKKRKTKLHREGGSLYIRLTQELQVEGAHLVDAAADVQHPVVVELLGAGVPAYLGNNLNFF